jgi:transposase
MAGYSLDLRKRIVDAVEERGTRTIGETAELFRVHESFIYKLLRQKHERGDIAPLKTVVSNMRQVKHQVA